MKEGRVVSVGLSMIKNFIYLYCISDGPGRTRGDTIDPVIALVARLGWGFCFTMVAAVMAMSVQFRVDCVVSGGKR